MRELLQCLIYLICAALLAVAVPLLAYDILIKAPVAAIFPAGEVQAADPATAQTKPAASAEPSAASAVKRPVWVAATTEYNYKPPDIGAAPVRTQTISRDDDPREAALRRVPEAAAVRVSREAAGAFAAEPSAEVELPPARGLRRQEDNY